MKKVFFHILPLSLSTLGDPVCHRIQHGVLVGIPNIFSLLRNCKIERNLGALVTKPIDFNYLERRNKFFYNFLVQSIGCSNLLPDFKNETSWFNSVIDSYGRPPKV